MSEEKMMEPNETHRMGILISRLYFHRDDMRDPNGDPKAREKMCAVSAEIKAEFASLLAVVRAATEIDDAWISYFLSRNLLPRDPEREQVSRDSLRDCVVKIRRALAALSDEVKREMEKS